MNLSFDNAFLKKITYSFSRAFVATFLAGIMGLLAVPNLEAGKALIVALSIAGLTAGVRAIQHVFAGT